jgi:hypothetical protein
MKDHPLNRAIEFDEFSPARWVTDEYGFYSEWTNGGGLRKYGYPLEGAYLVAPPRQVVQNFERARFERAVDERGHPTGDGVQLGRVNAERLDLLALNAKQWQDWLAKYPAQLRTGTLPPLRPRQERGRREPDRPITGLVAAAS